MNSSVKKLFLLSLSLMMFTGAFAQEAAYEQPVYLRFPTVPAFTIYRAPDSTAFTRDKIRKKKQVMFFIFSPDCGHCNTATQMMLRNMDKLKDVQIMMVTYLPYEDMFKFYREYQLWRYPNITVGRDGNFFFPSFFKVKNFPSFYIYDKKGNFQKFLEGDVPAEALLEALK